MAEDQIDEKVEIVESEEKSIVVIEGVEYDQSQLRELIAFKDSAAKGGMILSPMQLPKREREAIGLGTGIGMADASQILANAAVGKASLDDAHKAINFLTDVVLGFTNKTVANGAERRKDMHEQKFTGFHTRPGEQVVEGDIDKLSISERIIQEQAKQIESLTDSVNKLVDTITKPKEEEQQD